MYHVEFLTSSAAMEQFMNLFAHEDAYAYSCKSHYSIDRQVPRNGCKYVTKSSKVKDNKHEFITLD